MLLPETFQKSESLRTALNKSRQIIDLAFFAADNAEEAEANIDEANVLTNAQRHAGRVAIIRYKNRIRGMMSVPAEEPSTLIEEHLGLDALDIIAINAEREAALNDPPVPKPKKKK